MIGYARLTPGPGFRPLSAFLYYAQRLVTGRVIRNAVSSGISAAIRLRHGRIAAGRTDAIPDAVVTELKREGLAMVTDHLGPTGASCEHIARFFSEQQVVGPTGRLMRLDEVPEGAVAAAYPLDTVLACPEVLEIVNSPLMLDIGARYLGCAPTLSSLGVRWSFPQAATAMDTQHFHRDLDDWRFLKLFIYLTDVDAESGPHVYVKGSHKVAAEMRAQLYEQAALERRYGHKNLHTVLGPRGTAFIAATDGIHRGVPPVSKPRLILQAQYSLLPVFAFRYQPVALPATRRMAEPINAYVNRLLIARSPRPLRL